jgi:phenylalanyl-tRNA synthetase beta chain
MLVSRNWLQEYIDISNLSDQQVADYLTDLGLEIEGLETIAPLHEKILVGKVIEAVQHPNADSLKLCKVDVGADDPLTIVCGASNAREGIKVCVAQLGSVLPGNFKIKPTKIRGEKSHGMMCSEKELEISDEHEGIIELDDKFEVGTKISEVYPTGDTVFDVSLTPNRGDCLGYIGIARDLAAKLNQKVKYPEIRKTSTYSGDLTSEGNVKVEIKDDEASKRFVALYIKGVKTAPSPKWMQSRLNASGMRPINLIVDITNYVMLEMNHPIHAYDERDVEENTIVVRRGSLEDKLKTLDGNDVSIKAGDILICDAKRPIGLAGVMGGENSEVKDDTDNIIVEVAEFDPGQIRKTSKRVGLHTEASHRFERGIDFSAIPNVARRVGDLLVQCSKELGLEEPVVAKDLIDINLGAPSVKNIALRVDRVKKILGLAALKKETCINHLEGLGFKLLDQKDERILFEVPSWRNDITKSIDLIEEIGRVEGFGKIPYELPKMNIKPNFEHPYINFTENVKLSLASSGLTEVILYPFVSRGQHDKVLIPTDHPFYPRVELANPLSEEFNYLQTTQLVPMLEAVLKNRNHNVKGSRLFQIGRGYLELDNVSISDDFESLKNVGRSSHHMTAKAKTETNRPAERHYLSIVLDYPFRTSSWNGDEKAASFYDAKEICEILFKTFGVTGLEYRKVNSSEFPMAHPKKSATIWKNGVFLGLIGELHPKASKNLGLGIQHTPVICEIEIESLFDLAGEHVEIKADHFSFPPATRDIALLVPKEVSHSDFENALGSFNRRKFLTHMNLFDVYEGENVKEGFKSMAYTLHLRSPKQTLKDAQVEKEVGAFVSHLNESLGAEQR